MHERNEGVSPAAGGISGALRSVKDRLAIGAGASLPLDAATRRMAILAMSGAGKSNLAVVLAEQMHANGIPWVAIDPKGDWWGIRSSADGRAPGLPVPIFGGLHGDLPLVPGAGRLIADVIVDQRLTCVLDVSEFDSRQATWAFLADLGEQLLRRNRDALHVFIEEADELLPQRTTERGNLPKCLGVWQRLVKRGRFRGIGTTQITQRSAALNKDTLYQAEALLALRVTGAGDRKAIAGWVDYHQAGAEVVASLPQLGDGEGWIVSPAWLRVTRRVRFDRRTTFDSGATPVSLKQGRKPATLADVDLGALQARMADTIERTKADDPAELKKKLAEARRRIAELESRPPVHVDHDVPVLSDEQTELLRKVAGDLEAARETIVHAWDAFGAVRTAIEGRMLDRERPTRPETVEDLHAARGRGFGGVLRQTPGGRVPIDFGHTADAKPLGHWNGDGTATLNEDGRAFLEKLGRGELNGPERRILDALAELRAIGVAKPERIQVAFFAGYGHPNSKGFTNALGSLSTAGRITYPEPGKVAITPQGQELAIAGAYEITTAALHERVRRLLAPVDWRVLSPVLHAYPNRIRREDLAEAAGYGHPNSKGFTNVLGKLRSLGLLDYPEPGYVRAMPVLFLDGDR